MFTVKSDMSDFISVFFPSQVEYKSMLRGTVVYQSYTDRSGTEYTGFTNRKVRLYKCEYIYIYILIFRKR